LRGWRSQERGGSNPPFRTRSEKARGSRAFSFVATRIAHELLTDQTDARIADGVGPYLDLVALPASDGDHVFPSVEASHATA
jgi:hypothetical protein